MLLGCLWQTFQGQIGGLMLLEIRFLIRTGFFHQAPPQQEMDWDLYFMHDHAPAVT